MQPINPIIPASYDYLFDIVAEKLFAEYLVRYILFDEKPIATPALWQDAVIYIRFKQRDVWSLSEEQIKNAKYAILTYQVIYTIEHLKKPEILKTLNQFFAQTTEKHDGIFELFEQKFHAPLDSLLFTQEKLTVTKDMADNLDQLFAYPCWLDFTDEANQLIFDRILRGKLSDKQIDYFLGASDDIVHYDQWFKVAKHILKTTHDSHVFWTAGDILSIIWKAVPQDAKSQKWFRDEVFDIFWPRVNNIWPLLNEDKIDFDHSEDSRILRDSIGWLQVLNDLNERLPELGGNYTTYEHDVNEAGFAFHRRELLNRFEAGKISLDEAMKAFFMLTDFVYDDKTISQLQKLADDWLTPLALQSEDDSEDDSEDAIRMIGRAIKHAKTYVANLARERDNLAKSFIK